MDFSGSDTEDLFTAEILVENTDRTGFEPQSFKLKLADCDRGGQTLEIAE